MSNSAPSTFTFTNAQKSQCPTSDVGHCDFCAFVKVNVEGAEFDMIEMADEETLNRVGALAGELHYDLVRRSPERVISKLKRANFSVHLEPAAERAILLAWR